MFKKAFVSRTLKLSLATMLLAFSVITSAGSMRCFFGMSMSAEPPEIVAEVTSPKAESCCPAPEPSPKPTEPKCCCIDVLKKQIVDMGIVVVDDFRFEFLALPYPIPSFADPQMVAVVQQVRWPDVHGPPGLSRHPDSPRAPPIA